MSWAEEDWTVGLSGRVLQKVKEQQVQYERLSRENKQKQLQLDNINTNLEKQTVKYEEVRGELQSVQRELQSVRDEAKAAAVGKERLTQEFQTKQAQVCSLEGQLDASRTLNNKLNHEVKRLEAELEKLQHSSRSADTTLFSTPCWNSTSPWEQNGSRKEERSGQRDEGQGRTLNIRQRLQFTDGPAASLPRQQQQQHRSTPHRHPSDQSECFSTPLAAFPWERDDSRPAGRRHTASSPQTPCTDVVGQGHSPTGGCGKERGHRTETDTSLSEMRSRVSTLEEELSVKTGALKSTQNEVLQNKKELAARELSLQRARDELSLAHTRISRETERASEAEQRLKHLQEELKCQRQNAESSRLQNQQRTKEMEKQHQRDVTELQKERQCLEKQHQQEVNKLNQELQQARALHNALQAQADKLSLQKQALDKELNTLKEKLKWTEKELQESQKKEAQTQAKLTEAVHKAEGVALSLEQSKKREQGLEAEAKRLAGEKADALRLLKELQEEKSTPAAPLQPAPFCPASPSFSPRLSRSPHPRPSPRTRRANVASRAEQRKEEEEGVDDRRVSYPSDREPGEGIDSEHITGHISTDSERGGQRRKRKDGDNKNRNEVVECDSSGTKTHSMSDHVLSSPSHSTADIPTNSSVDGNAKKTSSTEPEQAKPSEDLRRENAMLRSELKDVREELQKRLDDLETQRRAEAEARTRLKQLSRKHASQSVEKEEQDKEWRGQLESERAETERLREVVAALELEMKSMEKTESLEQEEEEEEKNRVLEDRESEMIELNIQMKKQLAEVKAQLALEREERKREEEGRNQMINADADAKKELSAKLAELEAELEELKRNRRDDSLEEEKLSAANSPLTYLTLHDDELNSNVVHCDPKLLPSPQQHLLFCQSTNQLNTIVSQATEDLIHEDRVVIDPKSSTLQNDEQAGQVASELGDDKQNNLGGSSTSEQRETLCDSNWAEELERLQKEKAQEAERAKQYQVKLEALQNQVTCQTQQLTMAFEMQSQHISGLLAELQGKESTLLSQTEELQQCKQELDALRAKAEVKERDEKSAETTEPNEEEDCETQSSVAVCDADQPKTETPEAETATPVSSEDDSEALLFGRPGSVDSDKTESNHDSACVLLEETECGQDGGAAAADVVAELLALKQENQQLKQKIAGFTVGLASQTVSGNRDNPFKQSQNPGNAALPCLTEQRPASEQTDITAEGRESRRRKDEDEGGDLKKEDERTTGGEEELDEVCQLHVSHLEEQLVALQMKVRLLSETTQQQADELVLWRLTSQPPPIFNKSPPNTDTQDQSSAVGPPSSTHSPTAPTQVLHERSSGTVTVIREDELLLSTSSNKLQGRMLFSSLQHSNLPEPKSFHLSKKTAALQEHNQDTAKIDKESEKENQEINVSNWSDPKDKGDSELIQMSLEKTGQQQHVTKDLQKVSGPNKTKATECRPGNPEAKPNASRSTNEINTTTDPSDRPARTQMKSVCSQTEETFCSRSAPAVPEPELRCACTQTKEEEVSPVCPAPQTSEFATSGDKILFSGSFPIPADPARLAERIRRNRTQLSAAFDDTEYEPYGLPEVVMKGFADIPSGPSCPYIVRRGLLGTTVVPAPQTETQQEEETD